MRSGISKSFIAVPSARNSGFDKTENEFLFISSRIFLLFLQFLQCTFLNHNCMSFSSISNLPSASFYPSQITSLTGTNPFVFVGVFTDKNIISALLIFISISELKNKFLFLTLLIISSSQVQIRQFSKILIVP